MSAAEAVRFHLQSLLARGLASTEIAGRVGLRGASEAWGGLAPREAPCWYLWLAERAGAHALELQEAEAATEEGAPLAHGRLAIRYYPSPTDPELAAFSPEERAFVEGGWLDATGAPDVLRAHEIPSGLFVVGALDLVVRDVGDTALVALAGLDRLRSTWEEDWTGPSAPLGTVRRRRGERTRDVPGWSLAWPLFSAVAGLVAQVERRPASRLLLARQRGFELVHVGGALHERDAEEVAQHDLLLSFGPPEVLDAAVARSLLDPEAAVVTDLTFARHARPIAHLLEPSPGSPGPLPVAVAPSWFPAGAPSLERPSCGC